MSVFKWKSFWERARVYILIGLLLFYRNKRGKGDFSGILVLRLGEGFYLFCIRFKELNFLVEGFFGFSDCMV